MEKVWRKKRSSKGNAYAVWEERWVPRIHTRYLDCVIYLYHTKQDAEYATVHCNGGSGFLVGIPSSRYRFATHLYAVSNRHVIEASPVVRLNTMKGDMDVLDLKPSDWISTQTHDIAVCPMHLSTEYRFEFIPISVFVSQETLISIGDDLFMVGRFVNHEGRQRNAPSLRFGNIAMMPGEPVFHAHNTPKEQISFLADIRTVGGYSGSPVFKYDRQATWNGHDAVVGSPPADEPLLLGVEWGHLLDHNNAITGMSAVVPAWYLSELLDSPQLKAARDQQDERFGEQSEHFGTALT